MEVGTNPKCSSWRGVRLIESQIEVKQERQGPIYRDVRLIEVSAKSEWTVWL